MKNPLQRKALNNQWILIKSLVATVRGRYRWDACLLVRWRDSSQPWESFIPYWAAVPLNLWVSPTINIDVDTQILPVIGADDSCCGWAESGPMSTPDTLQLYVTDAWRVYTHINTLQGGIKSPYLTVGTPPPAPYCFVFFCSLNVSDQMRPFYKFNKDYEMTVCMDVCLSDTL